MKAELLAPAGNYAKLQTALYFGADAAYLGGKRFSLRTFADNFTEEELAEMKGEIPMGRLGNGDDVARAVVFLEENDYVTGVDIPVNGGFSIV